MFEFSTVGKILFGEGVIRSLPDLMRPLGRRILVVSGSKREWACHVSETIESMEAALSWLSVRREPTADDIELGLQMVREHRADVVLAIGGGSVIDTAKAIAGIASNPGRLLDYLEVVGLGRPLLRPGLPCIAVPTTAGTGAEVTRNAVIEVPERQVKVSLRSDFLLPRLALIDPRLAVSMPPDVTAATGFDALAQVMEPFVSNRSNPMTDALATAGMARAARSLRRAYQDGADLAARGDMALVSLWGGMCLANARLGAVHGLAGPIGGMFHAPHGAICAALLGPVMRANVEAAKRRSGTESTLTRYEQIARLVTQDASSSLFQGIAWLEQLARDLGVRGLSHFGVTPDRFDDIVERAQRASSMQGNPVTLDASEVRSILEQAH